MNRRTFDVVRYELRALRTAILNAVNPCYQGRVAQLRGESRLSLNVGSGGKGRPGWVNVELTRHRDTTLCHDIRRPFPLRAGSVRRIFIEHVLEHVDYASDAPAMLKDFHRLLEPGGRLRIVVPDAERFVRAYASRDPAVWKALGFDLSDLPADLHTPMLVLNHIFHQQGEHLFAYDFETLAALLEAAGFKEVQKAAFRQSPDPELAIDQANHEPYSLYVEAVA
jgi:predicted SAM-dependent methyltransferase